MEFLKGLGILLVLALFGLLINRFGFWSRTSKIWKAISTLLLLVIAGLLFAGCFWRATTPFSVRMQIDSKGAISKMEISESPIEDLTLRPTHEQDGVLFFRDKREREYGAVLPEELHGKPAETRAPAHVIDLDLVPSGVLLGWFYVITSIRGAFLVLTFGRLAFFVISFGAIFFVYFAGTEGEVAFLTLGGDD